MTLPIRRYTLCIRMLTMVTLTATVLVGSVFVFARVRPFWIDEWFLIYNLKTKSVGELWGRLDLLQQFPRAYLALFKAIGSAGNYSYLSLRLPSFMVGIAAIFAAYKVMGRLFGRRFPARYLLLLMIVSSSPFTEYFTQTKQYMMDMLLSIYALWQLTEFITLTRQAIPVNSRYLLLCLGLGVAPFFSYTYPIAIAPLYAVGALFIWRTFRRDMPVSQKRRVVLPVISMLLINMASTVAFYFIDVRQVVQDSSMHSFWSFLMYDKQHKIASFLDRGYAMFTMMGAGLIFENLFGILGCVAFGYGFYNSARKLMIGEWSARWLLAFSACMVVILAFVLFLLGQIPLGQPRLNIFVMPPLIILTIYFLNDMLRVRKHEKKVIILTTVLCLAAAGNVFCTYISYFLSADYRMQYQIFVSTEKAIKNAQSAKMPLA